jgi:uncharacterized membrane protein
MEALSDGIFSVAMTLLVLDIKIPKRTCICRETRIYGGTLG